MKYRRHRLMIQISVIVICLMLGLSAGIQQGSGAGLKWTLPSLRNSIRGHIAQLQKQTLYRIQVCASKYRLNSVANLVKVTGDSDLYVEQAGGYFKYLSRAYRSHADAISAWKAIRRTAGFEGSFVVVYQNGQRVIPPTASTESTVSSKTVRSAGTTAIQVPSTSNAAVKAVGKPLEQQKVAQQAVRVDSSSIQGGKVPVSDTDHTLKLASGHADSLQLVVKQDGTLIFALNQKIAQLTKTNKTLTWGIWLAGLVVALFLIVGVLFSIHRRRMIHRGRRLENLRVQMGEQLAAYIADPAEPSEIPDLLVDIEDERAKDVLVSEIIRLLHVLTPESGRKIKELYFKLELNQRAAQRLIHRDASVQARAIFELASLEVEKEFDHIAALLNHAHPSVRHEAIAAVVRLNPNNPLAGLEHLTGAFSLRDQLWVYSILKQSQLPLPDFSGLYDVYNPSVVMFAIEMVQLNRQMTSIEGFAKLLHHSYEEVRIKVIKAIGDLQLRQFAGNLIAIFNDEPYVIQLLIIKVMVKLDDVLLLNFLSDLVLLNKEMKIRQVAARELINLGPHGEARMQTLLLNEDADLKHIYAQVTS